MRWSGPPRAAVVGFPRRFAPWRRLKCNVGRQERESPVERYKMGRAAPRDVTPRRGSERAIRDKARLSCYISPWDREWFYHFREGGYHDIEWLEIRTTCHEQNAAVLAALRSIHVPGRRIEGGFRVYGYSNDGDVVDYI